MDVHQDDTSKELSLNGGAKMLVNGGVPQVVLRDVSRRNFITVSGVAAVGALIAAQSVNAEFSSLTSRHAKLGIPDSWVKAQGQRVVQYAEFIQSLRLRHITPRMVLAPHFNTRRGVENTIPPTQQWSKMAPTLQVIDRMVSKIGSPLKEITSAYRSPRYNRVVGGKSRSYHMQNMACDLKFSGVSPYHVAYVAKQLRSQGQFKGGIGRYGSFTHLDTRGINVDW